LLAPVGGSDRATLLQLIREINPKGKTPITRSFQLAADLLREAEDETTVVLVSDGKETCDADPCALVRELRRSGVRVRVHVVGFDVNTEEREQLTCIAEAGGGRYFSAVNAQQLQEALTEVRRDVVEKVELPPPSPGATFVAVDSASDQPVSSAVQWTIINSATEDLQVLEDRSATLPLDLAPGEYEVYVVAGDDSGEAKFTVTSEPNQTFRIVVGSTGKSKVLDAPATTPAGEFLSFNWSGPNADGDLIFIGEPSMRENEYYLGDKQRHPTKKGSPAVLTAPAKPGLYELRYYSFNNGTVLARSPLEVTDPAVEINAPPIVAPGSVLEFSWSGPKAPGDLIFIAEPGMEASKYFLGDSQRHRAEKGSPAFLTAPAKPGSYEIRYYSYNNGTVLARVPLEATAAAVELDSPRIVSPGSVLQLSWTGPDAPGDMIFIAEPGMEENTYPLGGGRRHLTAKGSPAALTAPAKPGSYEIRYYSYNNGEVLAKRALIVR
jgi:Ca-activated chloride channel family protein